MSDGRKVEHVYRVRFMMDPDWNRPAPGIEAMERTGPDTLKTSDNYGYADEVVIASLMRDLETGELASVRLCCSEGAVAPGGEGPSRAALEAVRDHINHYLEHHCDG
jgi:hypothetical protein